MYNTADEPQKEFKFHDIEDNKQVIIKAWTEKGAWNLLMHINNYKQRFILLIQ